MVEQLRHMRIGRFGKPHLVGQPRDDVLEEYDVDGRPVLRSGNGRRVGHDADAQARHEIAGRFARDVEIRVVVHALQNLLVEFVEADRVVVAENDLAAYLLLVLVEIAEGVDCGFR